MITVIKLGVNDGDGDGASCGGIEVRIQHVQRFHIQQLVSVLQHHVGLKP